MNAPVSASQMRGRPIVKERRSFIDCTRQSSKSKLEDLVPKLEDLVPGLQKKLAGKVHAVARPGAGFIMGT